jgi:hypothetical protein
VPASIAKKVFDSTKNPQPALPFDSNMIATESWIVGDSGIETNTSIKILPPLTV